MPCFDILNIEYNEEGYLLDFNLPDTMRICVKEGDNWSHTEEAIRKQINNIEELYANDVKVVDFTAFYEGTDKPLRGNYEDYDTHGEYAFMQAEQKKLHPGLYRYKGKIGMRKGWTECQECDDLVKLNDINWYYMKGYGQATVCDSCVGKYNYKKDRLSKGERHGELAILQFMEQDRKEAETFEAREKKIGSITIKKNPNFPSGTHLQAYIKTNRAELRKVFGNPNMGESGDGKSKGKEWNLIVGPHRVTIYDYREKDKKGTKYFNIGGDGKYSALLVAQALSLHRNEKVHAIEISPAWDKEKFDYARGMKFPDSHDILTYERAKEYEDNRMRYRAETFDVEFNDWANQEMMTHGKDISFKDWAEDEGMKHGNVPITEWAQHEEESHDARYGAESFNAWDDEAYWSDKHDCYIETFKHGIEIREFPTSASVYQNGKCVKRYYGDGSMINARAWAQKLEGEWNWETRHGLFLAAEETEGARCMRRLDEMIDSMQEYADEYLARHPVDGYLPSDDHHDYTDVADGMVKDTTDAQQMAAEMVLRAMDLRDMADDLDSNIEYDAEEEEEIWEDEDYYNIEGEDYWDRVEGMYEDFCEDWEDNPDNDGQECPSMDEWVDTYGNFDAEGFRTMGGRGFQIEFKNGYTISIMFGIGSYGDHYNDPDFEDEDSKEYLESSQAEVAIRKPNGEIMGDIYGWVSPDFVAALIPVVATGDEAEMIEVIQNREHREAEEWNWGGDPEGQLATALRKARIKLKKPRKPLKIEKLGADSGWNMPPGVFSIPGHPDDDEYEAVWEWFSEGFPEEDFAPKLWELEGKPGDSAEKWWEDISEPITLYHPSGVRAGVKPKEEFEEVFDRHYDFISDEAKKMWEGWEYEVPSLFDDDYAPQESLEEYIERTEKEGMAKEEEEIKALMKEKGISYEEAQEMKYERDMEEYTHRHPWSAETSGQWEIGEQLEEAQMNAEDKKRKKISGLLSDPFDELSLDSGGMKSVVVGIGIGLLACFGYSKWK